MPTTVFRAALALALLLLPAPVLAHGGASPTLIVTVDHVDPGTSVPIVATDFGSDSIVIFRLVGSDQTADLGHVTAGPDGHFQASFEVPTDFARGWATLEANGDDGSSATTQLLIGPLSAAPPRPGRQSWWQDPSSWLLAALVAGALVVVGLALLRPRRRGSKATRGAAKR
jgi:hypothetical protein